MIDLNVKHEKSRGVNLTPISFQLVIVRINLLSTEIGKTVGETH